MNQAPVSRDNIKNEPSNQSRYFESSILIRFFDIDTI